MGKQIVHMRQSDRKSVTIVANCRKPTGFHAPVDILNLSAEGCCIALRGIILQAGQRITLRPEGLEVLGATIRWVAQDEAGVEFDRPLYAPVFQHLQRKHAPVWATHSAAKGSSAPRGNRPFPLENDWFDSARS